MVGRHAHHVILTAFVALVVLVEVSRCGLQPLPEYNETFYVNTLLELHRQLCAADCYTDLMVLKLSNEPLLEAILPKMLSDYAYAKKMSNEAKFYSWFANYHESCNFIPIDSLHGLNVLYPIEDNVRTIYFIPRWLYEEISTDPDSPIAVALRIGYQVVYDLHNRIGIYHWNSFSNRTITIDPHNVNVPDELRDLHGYELVLGNLAFIRASMPFDDYLVELVASQRNATAGQEEGFFGRANIGLLVTIVNITEPFIVPGPGTTFTAIVVPRASPKPIISILVDPFDWYTWLTFVLMLLATAISISRFGEFLGRHHFVKILLELIMITLAGPSRMYGGSFENRIITIFCLMGIVLASSYQSLAISFLSFTPYGPEINTLAEIEARCIFLHTDSAHLYNFKTSPTTQTCRLQTSRDSERQTLPIEATVAKDLFKVSSVALNYMRNRVEYFRFANYRLNEYPVCYFISPRLREFFVFYVQAVTESGIYEYYYRHRSQALWEYKRKTFDDRAVRLQDFILLWYVFGYGCVLSALVFLMEVAHNLFINRKRFF